MSSLCLPYASLNNDLKKDQRESQNWIYRSLLFLPYRPKSHDHPRPILSADQARYPRGGQSGPWVPWPIPGTALLLMPRVGVGWGNQRTLDCCARAEVGARLGGTAWVSGLRMRIQVLASWPCSRVRIPLCTLRARPAALQTRSARGGLPALTPGSPLTGSSIPEPLPALWCLPPHSQAPSALAYTAILWAPGPRLAKIVLVSVDCETLKGKGHASFRHEFWDGPGKTQMCSAADY